MNKEKNRVNSRLLKVGLLLFGSGLCALIYQVAWLRELRLVFGASTAASAAVLAIFMGGLGLGGALLGKRADTHHNPLKLYAYLELLISGSSMLTPFLILMVRHLYILMGGSLVLGISLATGVRLILSTAVLGIPTFLMGGTLPAAVKSVETDNDVGRRHLAFLYGLNTLGAVTGAAGSTFFMLEIFGTRNSLWLACLLNALVGISARTMARKEGESQMSTSSSGSSEKGGCIGDELANREKEIVSPPSYVFISACIAGFAFFLMEIVWYRVLSPILGGSTYTFGLILAVALFGIGIGGGIYATRERSVRATLFIFAITCGLETLCIATAYALGDRIVLMAAFIHPLGGMGLQGQTIGWILITGIVVLPPAIVAGFQFPLLISLLGQGGENVGRHTGVAYAWNTAGAILGSLAGGFGLLPLLDATGCWIVVVCLLSLLGTVTIVFSYVLEKKRLALTVPAFIIILAMGFLLTNGPSAAWRHSAIGAGRVKLSGKGRNELLDWLNGQRRRIIWEAEGVESSIGIDNANGLTFIVNGKEDGNAKHDAATQIMLGIVSALLHPYPKSAMVIGLGTGSTAGWLADIDSMGRVDVVELEPDMLEVARRCNPVNRNMMENPKVRILVSDGREAILTSRDEYDLIVSEPSNPYRMGIASLYTHEFYQAVADRLAVGGMFSQWVQAYEVDTQTIRTIYATLGSVFPVIETWQTKAHDLLFVCSMEEKAYSVSMLRKRLKAEPFHSAVWAGWGVTDLEGFLSHFVANASLAKTVAEQEIKKGWINTDDRMLVEFGFARTVGRNIDFSIEDLHDAARSRNEDLPDLKYGKVDRDRVRENHLIMLSMEYEVDPEAAGMTEDRKIRAIAHKYFQYGNLERLLNMWKTQPRLPEYPFELAMVAEALADAGDENARRLIDKLRPFSPAEADAILGRLLWKKGKPKEAWKALSTAFMRFRTDPWPNLQIMNRALNLATNIVRDEISLAKDVYHVLSVPFSVHILHEKRLNALLEIASKIDFEHGAAVLKQFEPHVPWNEEFLRYRHACYKMINDPMLKKAERELETFLLNAPVSFSRTLPQS